MLQVDITDVYATVKGILSDPKYFVSRTLNLYDTERHNYQLVETFIKGEYFWLFERLKPKTTVIDIGANIGDTAIYFAQSQNVIDVYSYEPIPTTYAKAKSNISSSPLRGKIQLFNKAITDRREVVRIDPTLKGSGSTTLDYAKGETGQRIETLPLNDVLKGKKNIAIKCDCEGSEKVIFDNADLSEVYAIMLEYHDDSKEKLLKLFKEQGFNTRPYKENLIVAERLK